MNNVFQIDTIGLVKSCYKEKFGIPRQPGLVSEARATIALQGQYNRPEAVKGLEQFSHIWVIFIFHQCLRSQWKPTVRPPRLGGNTRVGVFASRATYRPNPIGMSPVELERVEINNDQVTLHLKGIDLLDGTPVIDIKPYIPYADIIPDATGGFAEQAPESKFEITFNQQAEQKIQQQQQYPHLKQMITQLLEIDPRPAYKEGDEGRVYGMKLYEFDLKWQVEKDTVTVVDL